jgi:hypothetical protein
VLHVCVKIRLQNTHTHTRTHPLVHAKRSLQKCENDFLGKITEEWSMEHNSTLTVRRGKGKAVLLPAWSGPEGSRKLRFPDFMITAQDGGKVVSLTH